MKKTAIILIFVATIFLFSCATINKLDKYSLEGSSVLLQISPQPQPTVSVNYKSPESESNNLIKMVSIGVNIVKAGEAEIAENKLERVLRDENVPEKIAVRAFSDILTTLDCRETTRRSSADLILKFEVEDYGIKAYSSASLYFFIELEASLYHIGNREIIWQNNVKVKEDISCGFFGLDNLLDSVITVAALSSLSADDLSIGFNKLTREAAFKIADEFADDYYGF